MHTGVMSVVEFLELGSTNIFAQKLALKNIYLLV
jgi:hypothetical protein